jgi:hypothetical protein
MKGRVATGLQISALPLYIVGVAVMTALCFCAIPKGQRISSRFFRFGTPKDRFDLAVRAHPTLSRRTAFGWHRILRCRNVLLRKRRSSICVGDWVSIKTTGSTAALLIAPRWSAPHR